MAFGHPGHPVITGPKQRFSDSVDPINRALRKVQTAVKTASFTADSTEATHYLVDATAGPVTVTLTSPALPPLQEQENRYSFIKTDGSVNAVTIDPAGSDTINGAATHVLSLQWSRATVYADAANWYLE